MGKRFDELSKAFATGVSRRQALMGAVGGMGAAVAAAVLPGKGALADDDAARICAPFCASYFGDPGYFTNGVGSNPNVDRCIAEASMGQGLCFTVSTAPMYSRGCHGVKTTVCGPNKVCCNGRCCTPDLCVFTNGLLFTSGTQIPTQICLGCPPAR